MIFYSVIYKPFNVLSQFTSQDGKQSLKDYFAVPKDVYPVGRLDYDSEGLLLLTNDKKLNNQLLNPLHAHQRSYWVQVDGTITEQAIIALQLGVDIAVNGKIYHTEKCKASILQNMAMVPERNPPIRVRKNIATSWMKLTITEGKNRQVRKMTAAVGYPTLRLIRYSIGGCTIEGLNPGDMRLLTAHDIKQYVLA